MFDFLVIFLGRSIFTTSIELVLQTAFYYFLYEFSKTKAALWEVICKKLAAFLTIQSIGRFLFIVNLNYIGWHIPSYIILLFLFLSTIPLFDLWISFPDLLIAHKKTLNKDITIYKRDVEPKTENKFNACEVDSEITHRLMQSLRRVDKNCVINV